MQMLETAPVSGAWEQFSGHLQEFTQYIADNLGNLLWSLCSIVVILVGARLILAGVSRCTRKAMNNPRYHENERQGKRMDTIMTLTRSVSRYGVYFVAILLILSRLGVDSNLIAAAGIGSFAIGFGAQSLVKDVINGFFMMFENQFSVGDYVKIDENDGIVEATAMRVTYLRSFNGDQIIIPNGTISRVVNYTRGGYLASVTICTPYEADTRAVMALLGEAVAGFAAERPELLEDDPFVRGVTAFTQVGVEITVVAKAKMMKQWEVERGFRLAIKEAFDQNGIHIPYPHYTAAPPTPVPSLSHIEVMPTAPAETEGEENLWKNIDGDDD